jgi:RimJ/RimL family protein N-acetyltransferase
MRVLIETDRLILRQITEDDATDLLQLDRDPEVVRFFPDLIAGPEQTKTFINKIIAHYKEYDGYGFWAAIEKSTKQFNGWFLFRPAIHASYFDPSITDSDDIELSYRLKKLSWGKGYATEGAKALILEGFNELSATCIFAGAVAENEVSWRVMDKIGLKLKNRFIDQELDQKVVVYSLQKDQLLK